MLWENRQSNYDKYPKIKIKEIEKNWFYIKAQ